MTVGLDLSAMNAASEEFEAAVRRSGILGPQFSPIEALMGLALMAEMWTKWGARDRNNSFLTFVPDAQFEALPNNLPPGFCIAPQIHIGPYIADFVIFAYFQTRARGIIECDGHDYHDRTPDQAQHDRQRDRWMQSRGFSVLRYTGREIAASARHCASDALAIMHRRAAA